MNVFIIAAITVDGMIGLSKDHHADWTSKEDKQLFVKLTKEAGVMIMGANTFKTIGRGLPGRKTIVYSYDSSITNGAEGNVDWTNKAPEELLKQLETEGHESVAICGGAQIYSQFLEKKLVDELYLTVEPIIFGTGVKFANDTPQQQLQLLESQQLNDSTILLHYKIVKD